MDKNTNLADSFNPVKSDTLDEHLNHVEPSNLDDPLNHIAYVEKICNDLSHIFEKMKKIPGMYDSTVEKQHHLCTIIPRQIHEGAIKIAVVGAIKSGKSTFINSILMADILKRGAGVVTSTITRVKRGDTLRARIIFKSWDEINHEIENVLTLIPVSSAGLSPTRSSTIDSSPATLASMSELGTKGFDLRRKKDRNFLKTVESALCSRRWSEGSSENLDITNVNYEADSGLSSEAILISNVLDGYENVKEFVQSDSYFEPSNSSSHSDFSSPVEFTGELFSEHKRFTGISSNAFFVKYVTLEIPMSLQNTPNVDSIPSSTSPHSNVSYPSNINHLYIPKHNCLLLDRSVEIADCQGIDSTDPSHISHIQDYLLSANMLIYVISSRTGLREADIKFLTIIKRMGIINNIFFILNSDFNEHDSLESLLDLERSVKKGLNYFVEKPAVYTISSLFNLFSSLAPNLNGKELAILNMWRKEERLVDYTTKMVNDFELALKKKIETERFSTILENHIQRLTLLIQGIKQRNSMFMQLLSDDLNTVSDAAENLQQLQEKSVRFESSVDYSIASSVQNIKREIKSAIKLFFDKKHGEQPTNVKNFISGVTIYNERYQDMVLTYGFHHALYCMFQDSRSQLDLFMAQQFNPSVVEFIHEQEQRIAREFQALYQSCYIEPSSIYQNRKGTKADQLQQPKTTVLSQFGYSTVHKPLMQSVDINGAKRILGLTLPKSSFATAYSANIRADAMARFSFYSLINILGKFISPLARDQPKSRALKESAKKIRKEALRSVMLHFDSYSNHLQEEYLFPLIEAVARDSKEKLMEMFKMCAIEAENIEQLISDECVDKSDQFEHVNSIALQTAQLSERISAVC